jgi:DNA primase large subunit
MLQHDRNRIDVKRRAGIDYRKKQFATPSYKEQDYARRLNFYDVPPTEDITLEQFEQWAIDRLRGITITFSKLGYIGLYAHDCVVLSELEACAYRNKSPEETAAHIAPVLKKYLPLDPNAASGTGVDQRLRNQRQKDHYSHFILRLAFSATEDLRRRFSRLETMLFKYRFQNLVDTRERRALLEALNLEWDMVTQEEKREMNDNLLAATPGLRNLDDENFFKVDMEKVPELVERRSVFLKMGKAYVHLREQLSMILAEFTARLDRALEVRLCPLLRAVNFAKAVPANMNELF